MTAATQTELRPAGTRHDPIDPIDLGVLATDEIHVIGDLDRLVESLRCSCSAGDDNPH